MNRTISVVIPTYNGAKFVAEALLSVFRQTRKPEEIVVVDDGSTDETFAIVTSITREAPIPIRITCLSGNSGGPSRPLNRGVSLAHGDIISVLEQDDLMRPGRLEAQVRAICVHPQCSLAIGRFSIIGNEEGDMRPMWPTPQFSDLADLVNLEAEFSVPDSKAAFIALLSKNFAGSNSNFSFTKESWKDIGGFDSGIKRCNDLDFILKAVLCGPIVIINEMLFDYRWRSDSLNRKDIIKTNLELSIVRLRAALAKSEWSAEKLRVLEDDVVYAAKLALRRGDLAGVALIIRTLVSYTRLAKSRSLLGRVLRGNND